MKILGSVITKCNHNKHFDTVVHLRYRTWLFGKEKLLTVFRHKQERFASDVTAFSAWYSAETGVRLKDRWCYLLDRHLMEKPDPKYLTDRENAFSSMQWHYHKTKPSLWFDQNFRVYVATTILDAGRLADELYAKEQPGFVANLTQVKEWQKLHKIKSWPNDLEGKTAREWATEYYNEKGIGHWGHVLEVDRECLTHQPP